MKIPFKGILSRFARWILKETREEGEEELGRVRRRGEFRFDDPVPADGDGDAPRVQPPLPPPGTY